MMIICCSNINYSLARIPYNARDVLFSGVRAANEALYRRLNVAELMAFPADTLSVAPFRCRYDLQFFLCGVFQCLLTLSDLVRPFGLVMIFFPRNYHLPIQGVTCLAERLDELVIGLRSNISLSNVKYNYYSIFKIKIFQEL